MYDRRSGGQGETVGRMSQGAGLKRWLDSRAMFLIVLSSLVSILVCALAANLCYGEHSYPRIGNLFEAGVRMEYVPSLSKWDVVGLMASIQHIYPAMAGGLRSLNPDVVIVAYFPVGIIGSRTDPADSTLGPFWRKVEQYDWWLYDDRGNRLMFREDYYFLNLTTKCPRDGSGLTLAEWIAPYIARQVMATGFWDGVILDAMSEQISWVNGFPDLFDELPAGVDCDRDGLIDDPDSLDLWWKTGVDTCLVTLRREAGPSAILIPNGSNTFFEHANGRILEGFPVTNGGWQNSMFGDYGYMPGCESYLDQPMSLSMIWSYWVQEQFDLFNAPKSASFDMFNRFTLASAMLGDGYYFLDGGRAGSLWWRDYYDLDVGTPLGPAYLDSVESSLDGLEHPVWRRDFTNATVLCNPYQQYILLDDNTWLYPEDGLISTYSLPGTVGISFNKETCGRRFERDQRALYFEVTVTNPNPKAAQPYRWLELTGPRGKGASGLPSRCLVGAQDADTLTLGLRVPSSLPLGTYCARVLLSGPDRVPVCVDTMYVTKVLDFEVGGRPVDDDDRTGNTGLEENGLRIYPQPALVSATSTLRMDVNELTSVGELCSVKIYDAAGRLVHTAFEGRVEKDLVLAIGDDEGGAMVVPGVYFLRVETRDKTVTRKIVLLK